MFDWNTFWHYHRRKWWLDNQPKVFRGLKRFPLYLRRAWPKKDSHTGDFGMVIWLAKLFIPPFLCWVVTDWLFPVNLLISVPLAFVLWKLISMMYKKLASL